MTPKQKAFVREYLVDLNATQAAIRSGYSQKTAHATGWENLRKPEIEEALLAAHQARATRTEITQNRVLEEITHAAFLDPLDLFREDGTLKPLSEMPEASRRAIAGLEVEEIYSGTGKDRKWIGYLKKIKLVSKEGMVTLAGRHLAMFTDNTKHSGAVTVLASPEDEKL